MRLTNLISTVAAVSTAIIMLVSLLSHNETLQTLAALLLQIILVTAALSLVVGLFNLLHVHLGRLGGRARGWPYSLITVITMLGVIMVHVLKLEIDGEAVSPALFEGIQVSLESALAGLLFFFLVYGAYRMMRERVTFGGCLFLTALLVALLGWIPLGGLDVMAGLRDWMLAVPATAGARGLLIGVALGTITVGLRVLIGQERAYRE